MKRIMRRVSRIITAVVLLVSLMAPQAFADATVDMSGGDNVKGGDTFYVAVTFGGGDVGRVDAQLTYDTNKLSYISGGTSSGDVGYVNLNKAGSGGSVTFNIKFQALKDGQTTLSLTTYEMYDLNEQYMSDTPSTSRTITINGNAADAQVITQETSPDKPVEATEPVGVDEMEPRDGAGSNVTVILIILALVLVLLIVIISIVLAKKKKNDKTDSVPPGEQANARYRTEYDDAEFADRYAEQDMNYDQYNGRVGRSGRPLDSEFSDDKKDKAWLDELMGSGNVDRHRDYSKTARRKAKEETEVFSDWNLDNQSDDYDDIDKW